MTDMTTSAVLIAPAALLGEANRLAEAMGWNEPGCPAYTVPLSPTGAPPPTHWGLRTWASDSFAGIIAAARRGELPDSIAGAFAPERVAALVSALIIDIRTDETDPAGHWAAVLEAHGLMMVTEGEEAL